MMLHEILLRQIDKGAGQVINLGKGKWQKVERRVEQGVLAKLIKFEISNVADWFWQDDQEVFDILDFPNMSPPYDDFWMEHLTPRTIRSSERSIDNRDKVRVGHRTGCRLMYAETDGGWRLEMFLYDGHKRIGVNGGDTIAQLDLDADGKLISGDGFRISLAPRYRQIPKDQQELLGRSASQAFKPFLLAICFMHIRNHIIVDHQIPTSKKQRQRLLRRGQTPEPTIVKTILIEPMKTRVQRHSGPPGKPTDRTVEKRRGHWKTYTADRPLFGRADLAGTWYWTPITPPGEQNPLTDPEYKIRL